MTIDTRTKVAVCYYFGSLAIAVFSGMFFGFSGDSHTPPVPYGLSLVFTFAGLCWFLITRNRARKNISYKKGLLKVHKVGLLVHVAFLVIVALVH